MDIDFQLTPTDWGFTLVAVLHLEFPRSARRVLRDRGQFPRFLIRVINQMRYDPISEISTFFRQKLIELVS